MRILILNQSFHPDVVAVAQHASELAAALAAEGHSVTVVASRRSYTDAGQQFPAREQWQGCTVRRLSSLGFGKRRKWWRIIDSAFLLAAFFWEITRLPRFDLTVAMTHPPMVAFVAALVTRLKGGRLVSWVMDLNPDEAIAAGWIDRKSWTARALSGALKFALKNSSRVVVMDRFMRRRIESKGIASERLAVIPPWSHDDTVHYDVAGRYRFRHAHCLEEKFVVMYSGNLSIVHPLSTVLHAAVQLRSRRDIVFCFIGAGAALPEVEAIVAATELENIICLPYQPFTELGASLSAADLHLVVMGDEMVGIVHPCKIYNILALGIPFLHVGPRSNHVVDIIAATRTPGAAFDARHGEVDRVASAILESHGRRLVTVPELTLAAAEFSQRRLIPRIVRTLTDSVESFTPAGAERLVLHAGFAAGEGPHAEE